MEVKKTNTLAILGLIFSILLAPIGLILSIIALVQINSKKENGKELAVIGVILSTIIIIISIYFLFFANKVWNSMKTQMILNSACNASSGEYYNDNNVSCNDGVCVYYSDYGKILGTKKC